MNRRYITCLVFGCLAASLSLSDVSPTSTDPVYSPASIVNAATQTSETLAPNTIATIYGTNLSWTTHAVAARDLNGGTLPVSLDGVSVYVNGILSNLFYISPDQINFLIPYEIVASSATIYVTRQGVGGLPVTIPMAETAPAFLEWNGNFALATHADGSLIS